MDEFKEFFRSTMSSKRLKNLSWFLLLNLLFMFVEIVYGIWTNSLGLLTDGAHMLLDCSAILIGIYCCYLAEKKNSHNLQFGYFRSEVLGTFINAVFLVFIGLYIIFESFERFFNPEEIRSKHLILVSFLGLLVNMVGIFTLHDFSSGKCDHSHFGGEHEHSHSHGSSKTEHNISENTCNHDHNNSNNAEEDNEKMCSINLEDKEATISKNNSKIEHENSGKTIFIRILL